MVLFSIHLRPYNQTQNIRAQLVGSGIHAQKISLKGYFVHLKSGTTGNTKIPLSLYIGLDFLGNQVHNASSSLTEDSSDFPHTNSLILPLSNELYTQATGLDISFNVNGKIDRDIVANIQNFSNTVPTKLVDSPATTATPANDDETAYVTRHVQFEYNCYTILLHHSNNSFQYLRCYTVLLASVPSETT